MQTQHFLLYAYFSLTQSYTLPYFYILLSSIYKMPVFTFLSWCVEFHHMGRLLVRALFRCSIVFTFYIFGRTVNLFQLVTVMNEHLSKYKNSHFMICGRKRYSAGGRANCPRPLYLDVICRLVFSVTISVWWRL